MLFSICIPTYSRLNYLIEAVNSCLIQKNDSYEICISLDPKDNYPDEKIKNWCSRLLAEYPDKVKFSVNDLRLGLAGNWNRLVDMASGTYIIIIGDDDLLHENYLFEINEILIKVNFSVVFTDQHFIDEDGNILDAHTKKMSEFYRRSSLNSGLINDSILTVFNNSVPMSSSIIKRELLLNNRFDTYSNTPEFPFFLKVASNNESFYYLNKKLAYYRIHSNSATSSGLYIDKLLTDVINIKVPVEYEHIKENFVRSKIVVAVNKALRKGDKKIAICLLHSHYYSKDLYIYKFIQYFLYLIPTFILKRFL